MPLCLSGSCHIIHVWVYFLASRQQHAFVAQTVWTGEPSYDLRRNGIHLPSKLAHGAKASVLQAQIKWPLFFYTVHFISIGGAAPFLNSRVHDLHNNSIFHGRVLLG